MPQEGELPESGSNGLTLKECNVRGSSCSLLTSQLILIMDPSSYGAVMFCVLYVQHGQITDEGWGNTVMRFAAWLRVVLRLVCCLVLNFNSAKLEEQS